MADDYITGQAINAGGQVLSSLLSGGGTSAARIKRDLRLGYYAARDYEPDVIKNRIKAHYDQTLASAAEHSIHPLVALGINPASGGGVSPQVYGGDNRSADYISRAAESVGGAVANRKMARLGEERMQAEIELLRAQAAALGQKTPSQPSDMPGQDLPISGIYPAIHPDFETIQQAAPPQPHPTHRAERHAVGTDGRDIIIPRGTPGDFWEQEFGDLGDWHPENIRRFFKSLQNDDWIPSQNDIDAIVRDLKVMTKKDRVATRRFIDKYLRPFITRNGISYLVEQLPWLRELRVNKPKPRQRFPRSYRSQ